MLVGNVRRFEVFYHLCRYSMVRIGWIDRVSNAEVKILVQANPCFYLWKFTILE